jgi:DNA-binding NarL/FixJ family response regulator
MRSDFMENRHRARILIADDHKLVAEACKGLLEPEFEVVAMVTDGRALLQAAAELRPDVVILDISMPQLNGLDAGEQIKQKHRSTKLIYLTMALGPDVAAEAFRRGASGYVLKQCNAEELTIAVRRVLRGESYLSPLITKDTVEFLLRSGASYQEEKHISGRQSEVLQLLAEGKSMKEIAYILQLKPGSVAFHKYRIMDVLGIKTSAGLIEYAIKHHMVSQ